VLIGAAGGINMPGERFCHPEEALLSFREGRLWLEDLEGGNGVFLRIRTPVELEMLDEFVVGDQLLRIQKIPFPTTDPIPIRRISTRRPSGRRRSASPRCSKAAPTAAASSPAQHPTNRLGRRRPRVPRRPAGRRATLPDRRTSRRHGPHRPGTRTGVFVRIRGEQELAHGDELLIGRTRLVVDLARSAA